MMGKTTSEGSLVCAKLLNYVVLKGGTLYPTTCVCVAEYLKLAMDGL